MKKSDLIAIVAKDTEVSQAKAKEVINATFDVIKQGILSEGEFSFQGFGSFSLKKRHAKKGRNPQTGESLIIPEGERLYFKVSPVFRSEYK